MLKAFSIKMGSFMEHKGPLKDLTKLYSH